MRPGLHHDRQNVDKDLHIIETYRSFFELADLKSVVGRIANSCISSFCNFLAGLLHCIDKLLYQPIIDVLHRFDTTQGPLVRFLCSPAELEA